MNREVLCEVKLNTFAWSHRGVFYSAVFFWCNWYVQATPVPSPTLCHCSSLFQTAQTVLVVVVVFGISWLPHHVVHLWAEFGVFPLTQASFFLRITAHCLAYSNSSVNPIIYAFLSENFRKAYKQVFRCHICNEPVPSDTKENKSRIDTPPSTNCTHVWRRTGTSCPQLPCGLERTGCSGRWRNTELVLLTTIRSPLTTFHSC